VPTLHQPNRRPSNPILITLGVGETFGEVALLDKGARSAYVASNTASLLLRLPAASFDQIVREAPALATPFAVGLARMLANRLRTLSKRYEDSIRFSRSASSENDREKT
jgi:CRP-like cAMP-binding protein